MLKNINLFIINIYTCLNEKDCLNCPFKEICTKSKQKPILRHILEKCKKMRLEYRYDLEVKEVYEQSPGHIE